MTLWQEIMLIAVTAKQLWRKYLAFVIELSLVFLLGCVQYHEQQGKEYKNI